MYYNVNKEEVTLYSNFVYLPRYDDHIVLLSSEFVCSCVSGASHRVTHISTLRAVDTLCVNSFCPRTYNAHIDTTCNDVCRSIINGHFIGTPLLVSNVYRGVRSLSVYLKRLDARQHTAIRIDSTR